MYQKNVIITKIVILFFLCYNKNMKYECKIHKKYKGKKIPKNQCVNCLSVYIYINNKKLKVNKPNQTHKSKKDYTRKNKHTGSYLEDIE